MKDKLSKQLAVLESNEDLIVWTGTEVIDESGRVLATETCGGGSAKRSGDGFLEIFAWCIPLCSTLLYKKANLGGIRRDENLKYAEDIKFYLDLAARCEFHYIAEPLAQYRIHESNTYGFQGLQGEAKRLNHQENAAVLEHALGQYHDGMSAEVKAMALDMLGFHYYKLGQNRKALMCFCRAIAADPFRRSNLHYPQHFFRFTQNVLGRGILERK
jgi:hypothetical protein